MLYYVSLRYAVLCYIMLWYGILCCVMLYYDMLRYVSLTMETPSYKHEVGSSSLEATPHRSEHSLKHRQRHTQTHAQSILQDDVETYHEVGTCLSMGTGSARC